MKQTKIQRKKMMTLVDIRDKIIWSCRSLYVDIGCGIFDIIERLFVRDMSRSTIVRWHLVFLRGCIMKNCGYDPEVRYQKEQSQTLTK